MRTHIDKMQEKRSLSAAKEVTHKESNDVTQFVDNRPEAIVQRKLQEIANNSQRSKQIHQMQAMADHYSAQQPQLVQKKENNTGLPDDLKSGVENLSGYSMDDVRVHYNSDKPAQLQAHAYAQGTNIHIAPGQEKHLPHEAWHVVQQKQGRVKPTMQLKDNVNVNDDDALEKEADVMGKKALYRLEEPSDRLLENTNNSSTFQLYIDLATFEQKLKQGDRRWKPGGPDSMSTLVDAIADYNVEESDETFDRVKALKRGLKSKYYKKFGSALDWLEYRLESDALYLNYRGPQNHSPLVASALDSLGSGRPMPTDNFKNLLALELRARKGPDSEGMESFAGNVLNRFRALIVERPQENPKTLLHRAIWHYIGDYMEDEAGFETSTGFAGSLPKYALGMQREVMRVGGFYLHFTGRTKHSDIARIVGVVHQLDTTVRGIQPDQLADTIIAHFRDDTSNALDTIEATTQGTTHDDSKGKIAQDSRNVEKAKIRAYAAAVIARWTQAAMTGKIHIVFDRAHLVDAYGKSSANTDATPANMMTGDQASIDKGQRITINLDSENLDRIYITLAHELAHAIGFNPTGMDPHGHFSHLDRYMEDENDFGSKLMFDAYYFETLIQHFYN